MIGNKIKTKRESLGYTQATLAEKTNLSIRTIQRVESGKTIPKGNTLNVLATELGFEKSELQILSESHDDSEAALKIKFINLSTLSFLVIPFANIFVPFLIWRKHRSIPLVDETGRRIINFQILWYLCTAVVIMFTPFLQHSLDIQFPLLLLIGLLAVAINILVTIKNAIALSKADYDILPLKIRLL